MRWTTRSTTERAAAALPSRGRGLRADMGGDTMAEAFTFREQDGVIHGPERSPRNNARHLGAGSIHDDDTAQKLGFRDGTVAGSLHMEQFPPLLVETFGEQWLRTGGLSLYFKYATTDGEPVRAF